MTSNSLSYIEHLLTELLNIPSPSGDTADIITRLFTEAEGFQLNMHRTHKGAIFLTLPGENDRERRFITAHVDTLGAMVKEVRPSGRLRLAQVGGYAWNSIEGETCGVKTESGRVIPGTVLLRNTSVHVNRDVGKTTRSEDNLELILDANVKSEADALALGVAVGDFVYFDPRVQWTESGYVKSRHLDDKASVAIIFGALKSIVEQKYKLPHTVHVYISNNEEIGFGGNSNIPPETVEYLAVDMGAIGKGQTTDEHCVSICALDGSGPYHLGLRRHLVKLAQAQRLHYAVDIYPYYSSDASTAMRAGHDLIHGLIGPGVANSHAYERMHRDAIANTYQLLLAYLQSEMHHR